MRARVAIIGGSGLYALPRIKNQKHLTVTTPYGIPSAPLHRGTWHGVPLLFVARHGHAHQIAPHAINYRANIYALKKAGATVVVAVNAVGGIADACAPGTLLVPHQLIDYTWGRAHSFYDSLEDGDDNASQKKEGIAKAARLHVDFTEPYHASSRAILLRAAEEAGIAISDGGIYAATQGPRFESAAEIAKLERDGATIVGMTGMPEAALAREAGLAYASLCLVVNRAAGKGEVLQMEQISTRMQQGMHQVVRVLQFAVPHLHAH